MFGRVLNMPLAVLLLAISMEPYESASQIEEIKPLSRGDRPLMNSP